MIYTSIDNFLPEDLCDNLFSTFTDKSFMWSYYDEIVKKIDKNKHFYFVHLFFGDNNINSEFFLPFIVPIISRIKHTKLLRAKANLYTNQNKAIEHFPHKDFGNFDTKTRKSTTIALYSLNDNNGYTLFTDTGEKAYSKKNRVVFFNGDVLHQSVVQTDTNVRVNVNFNYIE
mgnify:CR=1 FL=1